MVARTAPDPDGPSPTRALRVRHPWQVMVYIRQARALKQMTQAGLARRAGIPQQSTVAGWENIGSMRGRESRLAHMPMLDKVVAMLDALGYEMVLRPKRGQLTPPTADERQADQTDAATGAMPARKVHPNALPEDQPLPGMTVDVYATPGAGTYDTSLTATYDPCPDNHAEGCTECDVAAPQCCAHCVDTAGVIKR